MASGKAKASGRRAPVSPARRRVTRLGALAAVVVLGVFLATRPVTTRQGVNYEVSTHRIPLYLKALEFVDRSAQYQQLADEVARGATSDTDRALKAFDWTRRHVRPTPKDWPVVDDHILNIITRGYGMPDQQADVFATIATYAGVPAFFRPVKLAGNKTGVILTFVKIDGRWAAFDVANDVIFREGRGRLATLDEIHGHPEMVPAGVRAIRVGDVPYADFVTRARMPPIPQPLRAELQMPSARLWHELKAALRLGENNESD